MSWFGTNKPEKLIPLNVHVYKDAARPLFTLCKPHTYTLDNLNMTGVEEQLRVDLINNPRHLSYVMTTLKEFDARYGIKEKDVIVQVNTYCAALHIKKNNDPNVLKLLIENDPHTDITSRHGISFTKFHHA